MIFRMLFLICCPALILLAGPAKAENVTLAPSPAWVKQHEFPQYEVPPKPSQENTQYLLLDEQKNWVEQATYQHRAIKVLSQSGIREVSQIRIDFEPTYEKIHVHAIQVFRNGVWSDRLKTSNYSLIQKEEGLDHGIYSGSLSAIYLLDDIRIGDIIEYSYSKIGTSPLFSSHYTDLIFLEFDASIEKLSYRFVSHPDHAFCTRAIHTDIKPKVTDLSPAEREWIWEDTETPVYASEHRQPNWYFPRARVQMSQYETWQEVGEKVTPLFKLSDDLKCSCPDEMLALVDEWQKSTTLPTERALLALRFVQDEIRYLGIEDGIHTHTPHDPRSVFKKRFGDCKDKTFLLHTLLDMMNIRSTPVLVHSRRGAFLPDMLPSPFLFNHVVLRIEIDGTVYWVDPTLTLQGGSLEDTYFPDYHYGLLLSDEAPKLATLPNYTAEQPFVIQTSFHVHTEYSVSLIQTEIFSGADAEDMRRYLDNTSLKEITDDRLDRLQKKYGGASFTSPTKIEDDRKTNVLRISEHCNITPRSQKQGRTLEIFSQTIEDYLHNRINPERNSPYALPHPLWIQEQIHIENPLKKKNSKSLHRTFKHESLSFNHRVECNEHASDFLYELKHLKDHIPESSLQDYWNTVKDIEKCASYELLVREGRLTKPVRKFGS